MVGFFHHMKRKLFLVPVAFALLLLPSCLVVADGPYNGYPQPHPHPQPYPQPNYQSGYTGSYYRQQGQMAGGADARRGRPYNPQATFAGVPAKHRDEYNKGYRDGYGDRNDPYAEQDLFMKGQTMGATDARSGLSAKPSRYSHLYKKSTEDSFKRGYYAGYR